MQQLAKFLQATGRRLHILAKVICHFFRKGKLGMKIAIKVPFCPPSTPMRQNWFN